jgi:anti-sigma B factor antagonist
MFSVDLDVLECGDNVIVALCGELDMADAADVTAALTVAATGRRKTIVDLTGLAFIDCSGAAALARAQRRVNQAGGNLLLAAPQPRVRRVFELTRLIDGVSILPSLEQESLAELAGPAGPRWPGYSISGPPSSAAAGPAAPWSRSR